MVLRLNPSFEPRKTPVQARSTVTVDAIYEAAIQVLLDGGLDRLTTTRVAARAGVSVGTLYQYFPNKQALLIAVLDQHLTRLYDAIERACIENRNGPLATMVEAVVQSFVSAKMDRADTSTALYLIAGQLGGATLVRKLSKRGHAALASLLTTAPGVHFEDVHFVAFMLFSAIAGATRAVLEAGASPKMVRHLRQHLTLLCTAYVASAAKAA